MTRPKEYEYNSFVEYARQLESYCDGLENDAMRYRWLRENGTGGSHRKVWVATQNGPVIAGHEFLDAAIDAAMKGQQ